MAPKEINEDGFKDYCNPHSPKDSPDLSEKGFIDYDQECPPIPDPPPAPPPPGECKLAFDSVDTYLGGCVLSITDVVVSEDSGVFTLTVKVENHDVETVYRLLDDQQNLVFDWQESNVFTGPEILPEKVYTVEVKDNIECNDDYSVDTIIGDSIDESFEAISEGAAGDIQEFIVPENEEYTITAYGAGWGGDHQKGAKVSGKFNLQAGEKLEILVGQLANNAWSGGGGTFVVKEGGNTNEDILLIAGGNGGYSAGSPDGASHGQAGTAGGRSTGTASVADNGDGGVQSGPAFAGSGAGFFGNGEGTDGTVAQSYLNGGTGQISGLDARGGYGGGGTGRVNDRIGGGGGYSGGTSHGGSTGYGGGGGSKNNGTEQENEAGVHEGHGLVQIKLGNPFHITDFGVSLLDYPDVSFSWEAPEYIPEGYNLYVRKEGETEFNNINSELITNTEFVWEDEDHNLENGESYETYVVGVNSIGLDILPTEIITFDYVEISEQIQVFEEDGVWDWDAGGQPSTVDVLVVAGGGSGGWVSGGSTGSGGGGAGGVLWEQDVPVSGSVAVTVGKGGNSVSGFSDTDGEQGENSSFGSIEAVGGGYGSGNNNTDGGDGGSGGGSDGSNGSTMIGGDGIPGQGHDGGNTDSNSSAAAGGGGAGEPGEDNNVNNAGNGGNGLDFSAIFGTAVGDDGWFGGGGGGGHRGSGTPGQGGKGGGGNGTATNTGDAQDGTGGGGGGVEPSASQSGAGGKGIVIVRWMG